MPAEDITAYVSPNYVEVSPQSPESVRFSCRVPGKGSGPGDQRIYWNHDIGGILKICPQDCNYNNQGPCSGVGDHITQCWCDESTSVSDCPSGTTNVTFQLTVATDGLLGTWSCDYQPPDGLTTDVTLNQFSKFIHIIILIIIIIINLRNHFRCG